MSDRPPYSYDREGDLSRYRSVFDAIERRAIPEVWPPRIEAGLLFVFVHAEDGTPSRWQGWPYTRFAAVECARELTTSQLTSNVFATADTDILSRARRWRIQRGGAAGESCFRYSDLVDALSEYRRLTAGIGAG